jgi:hypothetical protein
VTRNTSEAACNYNDPLHGPRQAARCGWVMRPNATGQAVGKIGVCAEWKARNASTASRSSRRTRPGSGPGAWHRLPFAWRGLPWFFGLSVQLKSLQWSLPVPTHPWRTPSGISSRRQPNDCLRPSPHTPGNCLQACQHRFQGILAVKVGAGFLGRLRTP